MIGTIIIGLILFCILVAIFVSMVKRKKKGKKILSCGGNCEACQAACKYRSIEK